MSKYRFAIGQQVKIRSGKTSSVGCKENAGKIVTIKSLCEFTWAYELEELDGLWMDSCFEAV
jgi:hypothetical protein